MWCGFVMLIGRSHSGAAQVRCLALRARHCEGETERVARPTSITTESALITRCRVLSHARRCTVLLEIGIPLPSCEAASPSSPLRPSMVVLTLMCGRAPLRRGSLPSSMACWAISTRASARRCLAVLWSAAPRGLESDSIAALSAAPPTGSSQASSRYMPPVVSLRSSERSSKSSSVCRSKPSQSQRTRASYVTVDGGAQAAWVDEIVVGFAIEVGDRSLERPEFDRHADIARTFVRNVHIFCVNLYSDRLRIDEITLGHRNFPANL